MIWWILSLSGIPKRQRRFETQLRSGYFLMMLQSIQCKFLNKIVKPIKIRIFRKIPFNKKTKEKIFRIFFSPDTLALIFTISFYVSMASAVLLFVLSLVTNIPIILHKILFGIWLSSSILAVILCTLSAFIPESQSQG